jgi:[FeFe] hydrogenase H-cluster maturation GTPase HydF
MMEKDVFGLFGKMNAGKSTLMNLLTQQETSIIDAKPGTTTDTKQTLMEIHGLGPIKLYDTAGIDEPGELGEKKRYKVFSSLKECDLILLVIDPSTVDLQAENALMQQTLEEGKQLLILYNFFQTIDPAKIAEKEASLPLLKKWTSFSLRANDPLFRQPLLNFLLENYEPKSVNIELLPFVKKEEYYVLVIPMDIETPKGRLLRPQGMVEEAILRHWAYPVCFRLDLAKARSRDDSERKRFEDFLSNFQKRPLAVITDSQAIDQMHLWVHEEMALTTFSILMANYFSRGQLMKFVKGLQALETLQPEDHVLIVEACNHSRVGEDIGTKQIPQIFKEKFPKVVLHHNFGREFFFNEDLQKYKLVIHCGGCMIDSQKFVTRIRTLELAKVPFTNYGLFLAFQQGAKVLNRTLAPLGCSFVPKTKNLAP